MSEERLHPDGAPGEYDMVGRAQYGDERWENMKAAERNAQRTTFLQACAGVELTKAQRDYMTSKTQFWRSLSICVVAIAPPTFVVALLAIANLTLHIK